MLTTAVLLYSLVQRTSSRSAQAISFSKFLHEIDRNNVKDVTIADSDITGQLHSGESFKTVMPLDYPELINRLMDHIVDIKGKPSWNPLYAAFITWGPFLFLIGFWVFFMRQTRTRHS
jgi:cell division protease FtsH